MRRYPKQYSVHQLYRRLTSKKIELNPSYQREDVWKKSQERLLIDSMLKEIDIPKIYVRELPEEKWEVVDGQQRLRALLKFRNDGLELDPEDIRADFAGKKFSELSEDMKDTFMDYQFDLVILQGASDEDVEEMFLRMQNGTTLNAAEKRNAMPGKVKIFVRELAKSPFFESCKFSKKRYTYNHVAAQMLLLEMEGGPCYIMDTHLVKMYKKYKDSFSDRSDDAKNVKKTLSLLYKAFPDKDNHHLEKYSVISLFLLFRELSKHYAVKHRITEISDWFTDVFEKERLEERERSKETQEDPDNERSQDFLDYQRMIGNSSDKKGSLEHRHDFLMRKLFEHIQDITPLDAQRGFSDHQRKAIYYRDIGLCQLRIKCNGEKCEFGSWEPDHKIPWSKGGETTVANGQVACVECNRAKGNKTP